VVWSLGFGDWVLGLIFFLKRVLVFGGWWLGFGVWDWAFVVGGGGLRLGSYLGFGVWGWGFMDCDLGFEV